MDFEKAKQDEKIILKHFSNIDAYHLGSYISEEAIAKQHAIVLDIERNNQSIYHFVNDGASLNNEMWLSKKKNVVKQFGHSSAFIACKLKEQGMTFKQKYGDDSQYAVTPGSVPIIVEGVGIVAYMGVSGLDSDSDHELMMNGLRYLKELEAKE